MEERSGDAGGYRDQVSLPAEHFDQSRLREFGQVHGSAVANAGSGGFVRGHCGQVGQEQAGVKKKTVVSGQWPVARDTFIDRLCILHLFGDLIECLRIFDFEFGDGGPAQGLQMSSTAKLCPHLMSYGADICA